MEQPAQHLRLSDYLDQVQQAIKAALPGSCWVVAELSAIKNSPKGHVYLELLESESGREVAKAKAVMFGGVARSVYARWMEATGGHPQPGMQLLMQVKSDFSVQYGFSLQVTAIDPAYTLGDMQLQLQRLIASLQARGWFELQRHLATPAGYWRIAVISPHEAAGLADFRRDADHLERAGVCQFEYISAVFQGPSASASLRDALGRVHQQHQQAPYDVVCIIRGGGSKADLAWLNDGNLAAWVCRMPIPVYTGIGHEIDECVLDLVAHRRFDTPSKVIGHFKATFQQEAATLKAMMERITNGLMRIVDGQRVFLQQALPRFTEQSHWRMIQERQRIDMIAMRAGSGQAQLVARQQAWVQQMESSFARHSTHACRQQLMHVQRMEGRFQGLVSSLMSRERSRLALAGTLFDKTNPLALLEKGFALVRSESGELVTSAAAAREAGSLYLAFADAGVVAKVDDSPETMGQSKN